METYSLGWSIQSTRLFYFWKDKSKKKKHRKEKKQKKDKKEKKVKILQAQAWYSTFGKAQVTQSFI